MPTLEEMIAAQATELAALKTQLGELQSHKARIDGQSQTIGTLQGQLKKLEEKQAEGGGTPDKKTPVEQQIVDLKKSLVAEKKAGEMKRLETAIADHLSDKVISKKVARDLAKQQVVKLKDSVVTFDDDGNATIGEGETAVLLTTSLDALLETDLADYRPVKSNPSRDGLTGAAATKLPAQTKGYHTGTNGVTVVHPLEIKK